MENFDFNRSEPAFIIGMADRKICKANDAAIEGCGQYNPTGKIFDDVVYVEKSLSKSRIPTFFNNKWYDLIQKPVTYSISPYIKIILKTRDSIPDTNLIQAMQKMIKVLLHRLRSPLTGMSGYLDLMQDTLQDKIDREKFNLVNDGIEQLSAILDDLESLQKVPLKTIEQVKYASNPEVIIHSILIGYSPKIRKRIKFKGYKNPLFFDCRPDDLKRILYFLLENAIEHSSNSQDTISIEILSSRSLKISHKGEPIPEATTKKLFFPFVTEKAGNLGIGLTMALFYANQYRGSIFLTDNSLSDGIAFTFCLPPRNISA